MELPVDAKTLHEAKGVVDERASSDAACHAGGPGSIPGPVQTYV
jgi:hypothetical protein